MTRNLAGYDPARNDGSPLKTSLIQVQVVNRRAWGPNGTPGVGVEEKFLYERTGFGLPRDNAWSRVEQKGANSEKGP